MFAILACLLKTSTSSKSGLVEACEYKWNTSVASLVFDYLIFQMCENGWWKGHEAWCEILVLFPDCIHKKHLKRRKLLQGFFSGFKIAKRLSLFASMLRSTSLLQGIVIKV